MVSVPRSLVTRFCALASETAVSGVLFSGARGGVGRTAWRAMCVAGFRKVFRRVVGSKMCHSWRGGSSLKLEGSSLRRSLWMTPAELRAMWLTERRVWVVPSGMSCWERTSTLPEKGAPGTGVTKTPGIRCGRRDSRVSAGWVPGLEGLARARSRAGSRRREASRE